MYYDSADIPHLRDGYADVWKGQYRDQEVGVKVLRTYAASDLQEITRVSHLQYSILMLHIDVPTVTRPEILQGVRDVESSPSSECVAVAGSHND